MKEIIKIQPTAFLLLVKFLDDEKKRESQVLNRGSTGHKGVHGVHKSEVMYHKLYFFSVTLMIQGFVKAIL